MWDECSMSVWEVAEVEIVNYGCQCCVCGVVHLVGRFIGFCVGFLGVNFGPSEKVALIRWGVVAAITGAAIVIVEKTTEIVSGKLPRFFVIPSEITDAEDALSVASEESNDIHIPLLNPPMGLMAIRNYHSINRLSKSRLLN